MLMLIASAWLLCACGGHNDSPSGDDPKSPVATAVVSKHTEKYFVGEKLDIDNGQVKITREDGTSVTRKLNDSTIQINYSDADFQTAGTKTLTFVYNQDEIQYSGSFTVEVYDIASVQLNVPTKTTYRNYEEDLDLKGGGIKLSNADGSFSKTIPLDNEAVSIEGYDPTLATEANRTESLAQELTVKFGTIAPQKFVVQILYTDVLKVEQLIQKIADIDWTSETDMPTISADVGDEVMAGMLTYANMDATDRYEITDEDLLQLSRTALAYAYGLWYDEFENYDGAFRDDPENGFTYTLDSYEAVKNVTQALKNTENPLYQIGEVIRIVLHNEDIGQEEMGFALVYYLSHEAWGDEITIDEYKEAMDAYGEGAFSFEGFYGWFTFLENETIQEKILPLFDFMLSLRENMAGIDPDFDFKTDIYNAKAQATIDLILSDDNIYDYKEYAQIYELVDNWLDGQGFFNLLYTYIYEQERDNVADINALSKFVLPKELQDLKRSIEECLSLAELFANDVQTAIDNEALQIDTTEFLQNYFYAEERNAALKAFAAGTKENYFYTNIKIDIDDGALYTFDELLDTVCRTAGGYYSLLGGGVDHNAVEVWLKTFIGALYATDTNGDVISGLLLDYATMSVADQASIVSALHAYYDEGLSTFAFKDILQRDVYHIMGYTDEELESMYQQGYISKEDYDSLNDVSSESRLLKLISDYYNKVLQHEQTKIAFKNLLLAMDNYLNYGAQNSASNDYEQNKFQSVYDSIKTGLTDANAQAEFDMYFGEIYAIYEARFSVNTQETAPDFGEYQPLVDELLQALEYSLTGIGYSYDYVSVPVILIPHEKAEELLAELLAEISDDEDLMYLYQNYACFKFNDSVQYPLEYIVGFSRSYYYDHTLSLGDAYTPELRQFLASCYDTVVACFYEKEEATGTPTFDDFTGLYETALDWVNLTDEEFLTFYMLDLDYTAFYQYTLNYAMTELDTRLTIAVKDLAKEFFYVVDSSDETTVKFPDNLMAAYITALSGITMDMDITAASETELADYYDGLERAAKDLQSKINAVKASVASFSDTDKAAFAHIEAVYDALIAQCERALEDANAILEAWAE